MKALVRGAAAGAVGGSVLNAVTYLDMALTGRPASTAPARTAEAAADAVGLDLPGGGAREDAYGALAGLATAAGVGVVASLTRSAGIRLPLLAEAAVVGVAAMAASDGPMTLLGVSDPTTWAPSDWVRDVVPHLAFGVAVSATLRGLEPDHPRPASPAEGTSVTVPGRLPQDRPRRLLRRSVALGLASGARSSLGLAPVGAAAGSGAGAVVAALVGTELVMDKMPFTPSRLGPPTAFRAATAAAGAAALGSGEPRSVRVAAAGAAAVAAVAGAFAGAAWRDYCAERSWTWQGAVAEDVVAAGLTAFTLRSA